MFYRKVYLSAWQNIRSGFYLVFFGLFASILGFNEIKAILQFNDNGPDFLGSTILFWWNLFRALSITGMNLPNLAGLMNVLGLFIVLAAVLVLSVSSQGALVSVAADKTRGNNKFHKHWHVGLAKFWPLFGLTLLNTLIGYFFIAVVIEPMTAFVAMSHSIFMNFFISIIVFFVLLPLVMIISFVTRYGTAFVVLRNQDLMTAFTNSWNLFRINWLITIENAAFLTLVTGIFFLALFTAIIFAFVPFLVLASFISFSYVMFWLVIGLGAVLAVFIFILGSSLYGAYYNLIWAHTFLELVGKGKTHSKIYRLANRHTPGLTR